MEGLSPPFHFYITYNHTNSAPDLTDLTSAFQRQQMLLIFQPSPPPQHRCRVLCASRAGHGSRTPRRPKPQPTHTEEPGAENQLCTQKQWVWWWRRYPNAVFILGDSAITACSEHVEKSETTKPSWENEQCYFNRLRNISTPAPPGKSHQTIWKDGSKTTDTSLQRLRESYTSLKSITQSSSYSKPFHFLNPIKEGQKYSKCYEFKI